MEVILLERVEKLGAIGDVVKVKDGFARNFLLPQQEGAPRQRSQPQGLRSQPRADRGRQCQPPRRCRKGVEGRRRQDGPADPPGVEHRPALRLGQRPRHRRGARGRGRQGHQEPGRARPPDQGDRRARGEDRASPRSVGDGQGQRRPLARRGRPAGAGRRRHGRRCSSATPRRSPRISTRTPSRARPPKRRRRLLPKRLPEATRCGGRGRAGLRLRNRDKQRGRRPIRAAAFFLRQAVRRKARSARRNGWASSLVVRAQSKRGRCEGAFAWPTNGTTRIQRQRRAAQNRDGQQGQQSQRRRSQQTTATRVRRTSRSERRQPERLGDQQPGRRHRRPADRRQRQQHRLGHDAEPGRRLRRPELERPDAQSTDQSSETLTTDRRIGIEHDRPERELVGRRLHRLARQRFGRISPRRRRTADFAKQGRGALDEDETNPTADSSDGSGSSGRRRLLLGELPPSEAPRPRRGAALPYAANFARIAVSRSIHGAKLGRARIRST